MDNIDITDVPSSNFIDKAGKYDVIIGETKDHYFDSGNTGFMIQMTDAAGRTINDRIAVTEKTLWKVRAIADAAGLDETQLKSFNHTMLRNRCVTITTQDDGQYQRIVKYAATDVIVAPPEIKDDIPF